MAVELHKQLHNKKQLLRTIEEALADARLKILRGPLPEVPYSPPGWLEQIRTWRDYCELARKQVSDDIAMLEGAVLG